MRKFMLLLVLMMVLAGCGQPAAAPPTTAAGETGGAAAPTTAAGETDGAAAPTTAAGETGGAETAAGLAGKELKIGSDTAYPPFEYVDESGEIVGFDVDMLKAICEKANCTVRFQTAAFDSIFVALSNGEFDAVASAVTITEERAQQVDFTRPYLNAGQIVTVLNESTITGPSDLTGKVVGVQRGTTGDVEASKLTDEANIKRYDTIDVAMTALAQGDVDAVVADAPTSGDIVNKQFKETLKMVGDPFTTEYYGIAVSKQTPEVTKAFNEALAELIESGELAKIAEQWGIPGSATESLPESGLK